MRRHHTLESLESRTLLSTYYLSPGGNDSATGTLAAPWKTLSAAAGRLAAGDELILRAGAYAGGVTVNQPNLLIRSYPGERATISAPIDNPAIENAFRLNVNASGVTLRGLEFVGGYFYCIKTETTWGYSDGTPLYGSSNLLIDQCIIHDSGRDCIKIVPGAHHVTIRGCNIYNSGQRDASNAEGIDNVNGDYMVVQDCYIHDIATNGLYAKGGAANCIIERNRVYNTVGAGILLGFYTDAEFFDSGNANYYESVDSVVRNNVIVGCNLAGIGLYAALRPKVYNNTLVNVALGGQAGILLSPGEVWATATQVFNTPNRAVEIYNNIIAVDSTNARPVLQIRVVNGNPGLTGAFGINNNLYYLPGSEAQFSDERLGFSGNLSTWRTHLGGDTLSLEANPLLEPAVHYRLTSASPARDRGRTLTGFSNDINKESRLMGPAWDIGADEFPAPPPPETTPPTATLIPVTTLTTGGAAGYNFRVRYTDNNLLNAATFDGRDILVTSSLGLSQLATFVAVDQAGNGATRTVTYRIAAPGGTWNASDNAVYTLILRKLQVADVAGNTAPRFVLGSFTVRIAAAASASPPPDAVFQSRNRIKDLLSTAA